MTSSRSASSTAWPLDRDRDPLDRAGPRRAELVLHLHGLDGEQRWPASTVSPSADHSGDHAPGWSRPDLRSAAVGRRPRPRRARSRSAARRSARARPRSASHRRRPPAGPGRRRRRAGRVRIERSPTSGAPASTRSSACHRGRSRPDGQLRSGRVRPARIATGPVGPLAGRPRGRRQPGPPPTAASRPRRPVDGRPAGRRSSVDAPVARRPPAGARRRRCAPCGRVAGRGAAGAGGRPAAPRRPGRPRKQRRSTAAPRSRRAIPVSVDQVRREVARRKAAASRRSKRWNGSVVWTPPISISSSARREPRDRRRRDPRRRP